MTRQFIKLTRFRVHVVLIVDVIVRCRKDRLQNYLNVKDISLKTCSIIVFKIEIKVTIGKVIKE